jgi:RNA polymerase sigma factor (sigma-70 family)
MSSDNTLKAQQYYTTELYLKHHDWLFQWLKHRIRYPLDAADIVQDTFLRILQAPHSNRNLDEPRAYLVHIAKHLLIDQHRRHLIEKKYLESLYSQMQNEAHEIEPNHFEYVVQILDFLTVALSSTRSKARQVFLLYYFEGYQQTEIAQQLHLSLRAVQCYLADCLCLCHEARKRLSDQLDDPKK